MGKFFRMAFNFSGQRPLNVWWSTGIECSRQIGKIFSEKLKLVSAFKIDDDFGPDPDDDLDSGYTDSQGNFLLAGDTTELTTIDPHLKICNIERKNEY